MTTAANRFVKRGLDPMDRGLKRVGTGAGKLKRALSGLLVGFTAFAAVRQSAKILTEFEATMALVGATAQATVVEMQAFEDAARLLGATTRFSATEAAEGLLFLARAGFTATESIEALPSTLNLAQVGMIGLGQAADFASNIVSQFNLSAEETVRVVDALVIAGNRSNTSISQAAEAMKFAGTVLGGLGVTVEDTANLIGVLGDRGIQASMAGTGLRTAFLKLQAPTSAGAAALERYGLSIADVDVRQNDLIDVFEKLRPVLKDSQAAVDIFGIRNLAAAQTISLSTDKLRELRIAQRENRGEAERVARVMDDTLNGAFKTLISTMQEVVLVIGESGATGGMRALVDTLTGTIRVLSGTATSLTAVSTSSQLLSDVVVGLTTTFVAYAGALAVLKLAALVTGFRAATVAAGGFNKILLANPLAAVAAAAGIFLAVINQVANSIEEAGRETERLSAALTALRRGTVNNFQAMQRAKFDLERALEFGTEQEAARALTTQLSLLEDELFQLSQIEPSGVDKFFAFDDVAGLLPPQAQQDLADDLGIDLDKAIRSGIENISVDQLRAALENSMSIIRGDIAGPQIPLDLTPTGGGGAGPVAGINVDEAAAAQAAAQIENMFANLAFEQSLVGESADEIERLRAARELAGLAAKAQAEDTEALTRAFNEQLGTLQETEAAERQRIETERIAQQTRDTSIKSVDRLIENLRSDIELQGLSNEARRRAIILQQFEAAAVSLNVEEREKLLAVLEAEIGKLENLTQATASNTSQLEAFGQQTSDILRSGIADAILDYNDLGAVAENVFEQIRVAAVRAAVAAAFGGQGSLFSFGGGQEKGGAFGTGGTLLPGFASGGIVSSPSLINSAEGLRPIAEKGPEAVMPLKRGPGGRLGVETSGGGGVVNNTTINQTIVTPDANSFRKSERQTQRRASRFVRGN